MRSKPPINAIRWRCRRGMLELDRLLSRFVERHYGSLNHQDSAALLELLALEDDRLWTALNGRGRDFLDSRMSRLAERIQQQD